jgi:glycosyltransferase involved in cell wall biosynthesis
MPKVSVLIPTYNSAPFLDEAITSVLNQTYTDFEVVIVDNCSTDNLYGLSQNIYWTKG